MTKIIEEQALESCPKVKVIGIGGSGINAVNRMIDCGVQCVEFITIDCDEQALVQSKAQKRIQIGEKLAQGKSAEGNPEIGQNAAEESRNKLKEALNGADLVLITAGLGGGSGTGAAPIVAASAKEVNALTIGIVTKPFSFEGKRRMNQAEVGITNLKEHVDTLFFISDDLLLSMIDRRTSMLDAFRLPDEVLYLGVRGISDVLCVPGLINADFEDIKTIMTEAGLGVFGVGTAKGKNGATLAARAAVNSTLIENNIGKAQSVLFNITGGEEMTVPAVIDATNIVTEAVNPEANIIFGAIIDDKMAKDEFRVTVFVTNISPFPERKREHLMGKIIFPEPDLLGINVPPWMQRCDRNEKKTEDLTPRPDGKKVCNFLKNIRTELARANNIPFKSEKCTYSGICAGTCPKCDKEASYLRDKLEAIPEKKRKYPQYNMEGWGKTI